MKWATLVSRSTMTQIESWPRLDLGSPVIKSIPISSHFHSGIFKGWSNPAGRWCSALTRWQISNLATNEPISRFIPCHQNLSRRSWYISKIINNAHILGEQSYMLLNISCLQLVFDPDGVSLWKTNISRLGTLCHHVKCRGFGLFLDGIFFIWHLTFIWHLFKVVSSIMCWFGSFDIIWTILLLGTLVCAFLV